ncbi:uncharacterized protein LOC116179837 [Photinus pyralis]|uniref:uncharacterized protein LOC116179783 n=1 Tax=Photinus pyralis TaxID=7054 RepID=UPI001266F4A4|nr:uncharacterized protein LOC116179783 [Photinus pyralis]XP_031355551.1 uncharacterized protein LOC116179837 [Photinus pyralis]
MSVVKSFWLLALISALCSSVFTLTPYTDCTEGTKGVTISNFNLNNCQGDPCKIIKGAQIPVSLTLTAGQQVIGASADTTISADISLMWSSFSIPLAQVCDKIQCPMAPGSSQDVSQTFSISRLVPSGTYAVKVTIKDAGVSLACLQFNAALVFW